MLSRCRVVALSHCCVVVVPKLKHCRVPSSGWLCITYNFYVFSQWWNVAKNCDADARVCSLHHTTRSPSNPQLWLGLLPLQIASVYLQSNLPIVPIMLSGHKVVCNCHFSLFIVATPSAHWGLTVYRFFFWSLTGPWGYIMLSRCRCREAKKLSRAQLWKNNNKFS